MEPRRDDDVQQVEPGPRSRQTQDERDDLFTHAIVVDRNEDVRVCWCRVREEMGLTNLHVMVPFCRTVDKGQQVLDVLREGGLARGRDGLLVYVMAEIPSNIILAKEFAALFDGFSIGSNDLAQLVLGVDRDARRVAPLFDERNEAVKRCCATLIEVAHAEGRTVGICGQAPSDYPEFAAFLVGHGIDSIKLNVDALVRTRRVVAAAEASR